MARLSSIISAWLICLQLAVNAQTNNQTAHPATETSTSSTPVKPKQVTTPAPATGTPSGIKSNTPGGDAGLEAKGPKPKVLILAFSYGSVKTQVDAVFGTDQDIGRGISDLLTSQLIRDGKYQVIDRDKLQQILKEQNFSASARVDPTAAAKIGRLLGVDAVVIGDVTQFGKDQRSSLGHGWSGFGLGGVGARKSKAVVEVTARVVDVNTGEIVASASGRGESTRSGTDLVGAKTSASATRASDMSSSGFGETILGEAVNGSVKNLAQELDVNARVP